MTNKISTQKVNYQWYAIAAGIIILVGVSFYLPKDFIASLNPSATIPVRPEEPFNSSNLNLSIQIPTGMKTTESYTSVRLTNDAGAITIGRNTTTFNTIDEYFTAYSKQNQLENAQTVHQTVNGFDMIRVDRKTDAQSLRRAYFILVDQWVYAIETSQESLFPQLESVVGSFQYTGT